MSDLMRGYPDDMLRVITLNGKLKPELFMNKQVMMVSSLPASDGGLLDVGLGVYQRVFNEGGKLNWAASYPVVKAKQMPLNVMYDRVLEGMLTASSFEELILRYGYGKARTNVGPQGSFVYFNIPAGQLEGLTVQEMRMGVDLLLSSQKPELFQSRLKDVLLAVRKIQEKSSSAVPLKRIMRSLDLGIPLDEIVASVNIPDSLFFELYE